MLSGGITMILVYINMHNQKKSRPQLLPLSRSMQFDCQMKPSFGKYEKSTFVTNKYLFVNFLFDDPRQHSFSFYILFVRFCCCCSYVPPKSCNSIYTTIQVINIVYYPANASSFESAQSFKLSSLFQLFIWLCCCCCCSSGRQYSCVCVSVTLHIIIIIRCLTV